MFKKLFSVAVVVALVACNNKKEGFVRIKCNYMAYACGDCYPQYNVKQVYQTSGFTKEELLNKDIKVVFVDKEFENRLDEKVQKCRICYEFELIGRLTEISNEYTLYADSCIANLIKHCCGE